MKSISRITLSFIEFIMYIICFIVDLVLKILALFARFFSWIYIKSKLMADWCMKKKFEIIDTVVILND